MNPDAFAAALAAYHGHLRTFDPANPVIMDLAHVQLIGGVVFAHKPAQLLEFGIGSGFLTRALLLACACNRRGGLTCVDNAHDWQGIAPPHFSALQADGAHIILADEHRFLATASGQYDLIVCDGDHTRTDTHAHRVFELAADGAFVFFHDTATPQFPNLRNLVAAAKYSGFAYHEFTAVSLPGERTDRGLLMVINDRGQRWRIPPWLHVRHALGNVKRRLKPPA
jgi:predicted O-methyltransferase YrrM